MANCPIYLDLINFPATAPPPPLMTSPIILESKHPYSRDEFIPFYPVQTQLLPRYLSFGPRPCELSLQKSRTGAPRPGTWLPSAAYTFPTRLVQCTHVHILVHHYTSVRLYRNREQNYHLCKDLRDSGSPSSRCTSVRQGRAINGQSSIESKPLLRLNL